MVSGDDLRDRMLLHAPSIAAAQFIEQRHLACRVARSSCSAVLDSDFAGVSSTGVRYGVITLPVLACRWSTGRRSILDHFI